MAGNISERTFRRRRAETRAPRTTGEDLDNAVSRQKRLYSRHGYRMIYGHLRAEGLSVTVNDIKQSLQQVEGRATRDRLPLPIPSALRVYRNPHPNVVWYFDRHEKLRRWKFWIHGCIDSYSRRII